MKRWPRVVRPERMPSISNSTTSVSSVSGPKTQRIDCRGRTQRREPAPQRIDFGQGNLRIASVKISAMNVGRRAAGLLDDRDVELSLLRIALDLGIVNRG